MPLATHLKTVAMVTGTYLSIEEILYCIPYYIWTMPSKNHLFVTEIVSEAGNFSIKIWKIGKKWASELGVGLRNML